MEHILQIAISVDDQTIVQRVTESAEKQIISELTKEVKKEMFETDYWHKDRIIGVQPWVQARFDEFLEQNKSQIIKLAAEKIADKMSRTKAVKEAAIAAISET